jgi:hypothetical protein
MQRIQLAQSIMNKFSVETGLSCDQHSQKSTVPRRYLWTDAFAVCNYLGLYRKSAKPFFIEQAVSLVEQVHHSLGKHRKDSKNEGWLSNLNDEQAQLHPTQGGLRIGKLLNERQIDDAHDQSLEWQQDGQYFHYLTKWMHALNCVSRDTGDSKYNLWAMELAKTSFDAFVYQSAPGMTKYMYWKMSVDLSRPLVTSMGQHDPLDGLLTFMQIQASAKRFENTSSTLDLRVEITEMSSICLGRSWATHDALGIGGLLTDAYKLIQLIAIYQLDEIDRLEQLLQDIEHSLHKLIRHKPFNLLAVHRLAFRELGLAIGLQAITKMQNLIKQQPDRFKHPNILSGLLEKLSAYCPLHEIIEEFWLKPKNQDLDVWKDHADINNVMLATSLYPDGYLQL